MHGPPIHVLWHPDAAVGEASHDWVPDRAALRHPPAHDDAPALDDPPALNDPSALDADPTDSTLMAQARGGSEHAWDLLVQRYERLVFSVALRAGLDRADAADVTQSTFIALLDASDRLRDDELLAAWLVTVARRTAWRVRRRTERELPVAHLPDVTFEPALDWEQLVELHAALARLPQPCRDLLIALYFDPAEPSYAEIGRRLHRAVGGIGPMRGRCLERLRALMQGGAA